MRPVPLLDHVGQREVDVAGDVLADRPLLLRRGLVEDLAFASRTSLTTWSATWMPSLAKVAYALAWSSGLTSAVPSGSRELASQPAPFGAPTASAIFMIFSAPSSIEVDQVDEGGVDRLRGGPEQRDG